MSTHSFGNAGSRSPSFAPSVARPAAMPPLALGLGPPVVAAALPLALPRVDAGLWASPLAIAFEAFGLHTARRVAGALGQFAEEAGEDFGHVLENLTYATPERLCVVFHSHFAGPADALPYLHEPEKLANHVYAHLRGNGDEASGDGYRFRGRGLIQLTGRDVYADFGVSVGRSAERASAYCDTPAGAAASGCWYLASRGCLDAADSWDLAAMTRAVNGRAMLGHTRRVAVAEKMLAVLEAR